MSSYTIVVFIIVILFLIFIYMKNNCFVIIKQSQKGILERNKKFYKILEPGFHFAIPFIDKTTKVVDMREHVRDMPTMMFLTQENVNLAINYLIYFSIDNVYDYIYNSQSPLKELEDFSFNLIKDVVESMTFETSETFLSYANDKLSFSLIQYGNLINGIKINKIEINRVSL